MAGSPLYGLAPDRRALMRDKLAQQLLAQGVDTSPIQSPWQGAARLAQALMGGHMMKKGEEETAKRETDYASGLNAALMGATGAGDIASRLAGSGNADLARLAPQFTLKEIEAQQKKVADAAKAEADKALKKWEYENDPSKLAAGKPSGIVAAYEYAKGQGFPGSIFDYQKQMAEAGRTPAQGHAPPASIAEYNFAKGQGFTGSLQDWKAKSGGEGGRFKGNAMDAQAASILLEADPGSREYEMAWLHLYGPKDIQQADGTVVRMQPPVPEGIPKPRRAQAAQPTGSTPAPQVIPQDPGLPPAPPQTTTDLPGGGSRTVIGEPKPPPMNEGQANAALYADRMRGAEPIIEQMSDEGLKLRNRAASSVPVAGNYMVTPGYQQLEQAQRDFVNATLRRESGAVISPSEFDNAAKQYFPQPGDSPETIAQKKRNRQTAAEGIARAAGPAYKPGTSGAAPSAIRVYNPATGKLE